MKTERISAKELKALTKADSLPQAITLLYDRLKKRHWQCHVAGEMRTFECGGIDWQKHYLSLLTMWNPEGTENTVAYRYARIPIPDAIDCLSGNFSFEYLRD